ncbi:MAG: type II toxin-antitoxin system prevent-host-death family antitoxin [Gammaproteobacteria bacterium]|nr:type II toxin-antitoxin system prevent-host-death family antitoxin [Gammaproteobacteria bacterium]
MNGKADKTGNVDIGMDWRLTEAKNRLSEVVTKALNDRPQRIVRRGEAVVVVAEKTYGWLTGGRSGFIGYLLNGPSLEGVTTERDRRSMCDVEL